MRSVVLDTETTGLDPRQGHRIIEIGCVELCQRTLTERHYHVYIHPDREVEAEAMAVHGITNEFLADKPRFHLIADEFFEFIRGAELIIHNAAFDVGFINHEFARLRPSPGRVEDHCTVLDTLAMARHRHPGQKNNLDALCKRYSVDNSKRDLHGALLDARILAQVYLAMTGGQTALSLDEESESQEQDITLVRRLDLSAQPLRIVRASQAETAAHEALLDKVGRSAGKVIWRQQEAPRPEGKPGGGQK